jgi:hypothetical protein
VLVGDDVAALVDCDTDPVEVQPGGDRSPPDRDEKPLGGDVRAVVQ